MVLEEVRSTIMDLTQVETALLVLISGFIGSIVVYIVTPPVARFASEYSDEIEPKPLLRLARPPLTFTMIFIGGWTALQVLQLPSEVTSIAESVGYTILTLLWTRSIYVVGQKIIKGITKYRYDEEVVPIMNNVWTLATIMTVVLFIFKAWDVDITPILASAGVIGVVIGLAARETISNFFGSIALYADDTYEKGDFIRVQEKDVEGFVDHISIRSTELRTLSNNSITIPNSTLHKSVIQNKSEPTDSHRVEIEVGVSYDVNPEEARQTIDDAIEENVSEGDSVAAKSVDNYRVFIKSFADSSVVYRIFVWIEYPHQQPNVRDSLQEIVYNALEENEMEIPYPQRTVHFPDDGDFDKMDKSPESEGGSN